MLNYDKDLKDIKVLGEIGVPFHEMNGYSIIEGEEFILREYHTNRREKGYEVPEKYQPMLKPRKEREMKYQSKMMADIEGERINRLPEGFPDPNMWYEPAELMIDPETKEEIPIWKYKQREYREEREQSYLNYCKNIAKMKKNKASAELLKAHKLKKQKNEGKEKEEKLKKALKERAERLMRN